VTRTLQGDRGHKGSAASFYKYDITDEKVPYLHGEEGDVVELFDEASDLLTGRVAVEPRAPQDLHLGHGTG